MLLEKSCPTQLKKMPLYNSKGTPGRLSQLKRNTNSSTTTRLKSFAITKKEPPAMKLGAPRHRRPELERISLPNLERSPLAHCT